MVFPWIYYKHFCSYSFPKLSSNSTTVSGSYTSDLKLNRFTNFHLLHCCVCYFSKKEFFSICLSFVWTTGQIFLLQKHSFNWFSWIKCIDWWSAQHSYLQTFKRTFPQEKECNKNCRFLTQQFCENTKKDRMLVTGALT